MSSTFHRARLIDREEVGGNLVLVSLQPEPGVRDSYARPGQYVSVRADGASSHFVLAGEVAASRWQLLVRPGGTVANAIIALPPDENVETTRAVGAGFPVAEARERPLLLAATGSGIAAMRPVIHDRIDSHDAGNTWLYLGIRTQRDVPLAGELAEWRQKGVHVTVCLSRDAASSGDTVFAEGYVQDVARRRMAKSMSRAKGAMIFAAGVKEMIAGMRSLALGLGIAETDVRTNY